jgi:hypothetical protein
MAPSNGIDDDYRQALGSLVFEVSKLDGKMTELIAALVGIDIGLALILVHHQQFANKWDSVRALFELIYPNEDDPAFQPVNDVLARAKAVADFRNTVVHAIWRVDEGGTPHTVRFPARGKLTRSRQPAPVEKIRQHALESVELVAKLEMIAQDYRGFIKPS